MAKRTNPFPGLRPFNSAEDYLFFGREGQSDDLLRLLQQGEPRPGDAPVDPSRFVAVVGVSGSGKSSLVRAGLLPSLVGGLMAEAGSDWRIAMLRPGSDPIANLAHALLSPESLAAGEELSTVLDATPAAGPETETQRDAVIRASLVETTLRRGGLGLVDAVAQLNLQPQERLLVVVDQFEELFRYAAADDGQTDSRSVDQALAADRATGWLPASADPTDSHLSSATETAAAFVRLLLEAGRSRAVPVYVVITMRSDFLGDCAQFRDLPEAINHGQYLIPRMTRTQRRRAIEGPVAVGGATITPRLVQRLLNDVGDSPDQLPILQHALMRTWDYWKQRGEADTPLDLPHYEATGGMAQALSNHADEVYYAELPDARSRDLARRIFKGVTQLGPDNRGVRRPTSLAQLCELTGADREEVTAVLAPYRRPDCAFIAPPLAVDLTPESTVDISHESLMRIWQRLEGWVYEEAQDAAWLRRIGDGAHLHGRGEAGLWRDPQLALALAWRGEKAPTAAWGARYVPNFAAGIAFLEESQEAHQAEEQRAAAQARALETARQQELERQRQLAAVERQRAEESEAHARRLRWLVTGLACAVLAAAWVTWIAW